MTVVPEPALDQDLVIALLAGLDSVAVETVLPGATLPDGAPVPEIAIGDTFAFYAPGGFYADIGTKGRGAMPFVTLITKDYPDDARSDLGRAGAYRLNLNVGRECFSRWAGYSPAEHAANADRWDYAQPDTVVPHPLYAAQSWVSIVNPARLTLVRELLTQARDIAAHRHRRG